MKQIEFRYKRFGFTRRKRIAVPNKMSEMSPTQYLATIRLSKKWITEEEFFRQFFGLSSSLLAKLPLYYLYRLSALLGFLKDKNGRVDCFYLSELPGRIIAPLPKLRGMTLQQFMTVDTFASWYMAFEKDEYLDSCIATLYLKEGESFSKNGGNPLNMEKRIPTIRRLPFDLKYSILMNWVLIKEWLSSAYPSLFPEGKPSTNSRGDKIKSKPIDWLAVFDAFVGDNIADMDAYKELSALDAFRIMNRRIADAKKQKR